MKSMLLANQGTDANNLEFLDDDDQATSGSSETFVSLSAGDEGSNRHLICIIGAHMTVTPPACGNLDSATGYTIHGTHNETGDYDFDLAIISQIDDTGTSENVTVGWDDTVSASGCALFRIFRDDTSITPDSTGTGNDSLASADLGDYSLIIAAADPGASNAAEITLGSGSPTDTGSLTVDGSPNFLVRWAIVMNGGTTTAASSGADAMLRVTWSL